MLATDIFNYCYFHISNNYHHHHHGYHPNHYYHQLYYISVDISICYGDKSETMFSLILLQSDIFKCRERKLSKYQKANEVKCREDKWTRLKVKD